MTSECAAHRIRIEVVVRLLRFPSVVRSTVSEVALEHQTFVRDLLGESFADADVRPRGGEQLLAPDRARLREKGEVDRFAVAVGIPPDPTATRATDGLFACVSDEDCAVRRVLESRPRERIELDGSRYCNSL